MPGEGRVLGVRAKEVRHAGDDVIAASRGHFVATHHRGHGGADASRVKRPVNAVVVPEAPAWLAQVVRCREHHVVARYRCVTHGARSGLDHLSNRASNRLVPVLGRMAVVDEVRGAQDRLEVHDPHVLLPRKIRDDAPILALNPVERGILLVRGVEQHGGPGGVPSAGLGRGEVVQDSAVVGAVFAGEGLQSELRRLVSLAHLRAGHVVSRDEPCNIRCRRHRRPCRNRLVEPTLGKRPKSRRQGTRRLVGGIVVDASSEAIEIVKMAEVRAVHSANAAGKASVRHRVD